MRETRTLLEQYACPGCGLQSEGRAYAMNRALCIKCRLGVNLEKALAALPGARFCPLCEVHIGEANWERHELSKFHRLNARLVLVTEGVR